jgi:hypothetical protein
MLLKSYSQPFPPTLIHGEKSPFELYEIFHKWDEKHHYDPKLCLEIVFEHLKKPFANDEEFERLFKLLDKKQSFILLKEDIERLKNWSVSLDAHESEFWYAMGQFDTIIEQCKRGFLVFEF